MNKFEYKNLSPFKWFVLENFPFIEADFDALTDWQLYCKLGKEINKIIDSQNAVGTEMEKFSQAFVELQNYVNNYFDNLDVQEEINNKLNEMVEDGTLDEIIGKYILLYTPRVYNTYDLMKISPIEVGMKINTLGYHKLNDGGNATYIITNIKPSSYYETLDNGLYAELIITNNKVNPQMFGAYGDDIHDDTNALQNCIDFVENIVLNNNSISKGDPEIELFGTYKITNTIILSPYLTYHIKGDATIKSYLTNGTAVKLIYRNVITDNNAQNTSNGWTRGDIIYGGNLFITNNENIINQNVIGLQIGNENDLGVHQGISRGRIQNISVTYFNIGIKIYSIHFYIHSFYNIIIHNTNIDMQIGDEGQTNNDSGENILFQNCLFGSATLYGFNNNIALLALSFINCSFDFNRSGAIRMFKGCIIKLDNCHMECCQGVGGDIQGMIGTVNDNVYSTVMINNLYVADAYNTTPIVYGKNISLLIESISESVQNSAIDYMKENQNFYITPNSYVKLNNGIFTHLRMTAPKCNLLKKYNLSNENVAPIVSGGTTKWIKYNYANNGSMQISNVDNENVIDITPTDTNNFNVGFNIDEKIEINNSYKNVCVSYLYKLSMGNVEPRLQIGYFDENDQLISTKLWSGSSDANRLNKTNQWYKPLNNGFVSDIPQNAKYLKITCIFIAREYCPQLFIKQLHCELK